MATISAAEEQHRLQAFVTEFRYQRCSIGGISFYMNPQSYNFLSEMLYSEVPTASGYGFYDWGMKPYEFTLEGTTGVAGLFELDDSSRMKSFRPLFGNSGGKTTFTYPSRLRNHVMRDVIVLRMEDYANADHPHYYFYRLLMKKYPDKGPSYQFLSGGQGATNTVPTGAQGSTGIR